MIDTHSLQFARFSRAHVVIDSDDCYYLSSLDFALIMPSDQLAALVCTWFTLGMVQVIVCPMTRFIWSSCSPPEQSEHQEEGMENKRSSSPRV